MTRDFQWLAQPEAARRWSHRIWHRALWWADRLLLKRDISGMERMPAQGPLIVYYNHIHYLDPFVLTTRFVNRRYVVPVAKIELERIFFVGWGLRGYGVIFVHRGEADIPAMRGSLAVLKAGHALLIAPEGTRSQTGALIQAEKGLGLLVYRTNPILMPIGVWGTRDFPSTYKRLRRPVVHYQFGAPFRFNFPSDVTRRQAEDIVTDYAMRRLAQCLPPSMRGVYVDPPSDLSCVEEV